MSDILITETLPYSSKYLENISVRYLNLRELARGALASRELHCDGYWKIDNKSGPVAYHAIKNGTPYRFIGRDVKGLDDFLNWLENDITELILSYYFLEENLLKYILRCWTEEPVLRNLKGPKGQIMELYEKLANKNKSGLIRVVKDNMTTLIPMIDGIAETGWMPEKVLDGPGVWEFLEYEAVIGGTGYFYPGKTASLSGMGLDEIKLLIDAFNKWYVLLLDIWSNCFIQSVNVFGKLRQEKPVLGKLIFIPDEGLQQKGSFEDPQRLPEVILLLIKAISAENSNPESCLQLFRDVNKDQRHALNSVGFTELMGKK
ncbi:MAG: hypothetical protein K8S24_03700 [Candidatus Aegiribacteria sp.]|nr:hypothetical protein [Candidatus Aegiribacteria sp.]